MKKYMNRFLYMCVAIGCMGVSGCSDEYVDFQSSVEQNGERSTRAYSVSCTIENLTAGELQEQLTAKLEEQNIELSTLQSLTVTGEFSNTDAEYLKTYVSKLQALDLSGVTQLKTSERYYNSEVGGYSTRYVDTDKIAASMFYNLANMEKLILPEGNIITAIGDKAFGYCQSLESIVISESVTTINANAFYNCSNLKTVYWHSPSDVPEWLSDYSGTTLYLISHNGVFPSYSGNWETVNKNYSTDKIVLAAGLETDFTLEKSISVDTIQYTMSFNTVRDDVYTGYGSSANWYTITLPFTPTRIYIDDRELAPFYSEKKDAKPFWLRELTADGFVNATTIEPHHAYIISMPYNPDKYKDEYNIQGAVTFEAENVTLEATADVEITPVVGPDFTMYPSYSFIPKASNVYTLSTGYYSGEYRCYFVRSLQEVHPFEAYVMSNPYSSAIALDGISAATCTVSSRSAETRAGNDETDPTEKREPQVDDI